MLFRFLLLVYVCEAFPLKCPEPAQWSTRARGHCLDPTKYFCLKNELINGYSENCTIFDFLKPGRKHVLRGGLDADICSLDRYQPWSITFYTNVSTNCIFLKSSCNEEGQVIYENGNRSTDIICKCDYTRGYDFVVKPRNPCFCVPSEEDCSCYLKKCKDSRYVLSPDYTCVHSQKNISINQCKPIIFVRIDRESNQSDTDDIVRTQNISISGKYITTTAIVITSVSLVVIFLSYALAKVVANCYVQHTYFSKELTIYPTTQIEGDTVLICCKIKLKNVTGIWNKDENPMTYNDNRIYTVNGREHILTITKADMSDNATYCIEFGDVKRQIKLEIEDYVSTDLTIDPKKPVEGNAISISCISKQKNQSAMWCKDGIPISSTDKLYCEINGKTHTLKILKAELSDNALYSINFEGGKRRIMVTVEDYFSKALSIDPSVPIEGNDISISCAINQKNIVGKWYKNGSPVSSTDRIECSINGKIHTLRILNAELSDSAVFCIDFNGVKRQIQLHVEDYFSKDLSIDPERPIEGNDILISCEIKQKNVFGMWYQNGSLLTSTEKMKYDVNERKHLLTITKANLSDNAVYLIDFGGAKRQLKIEVEDFFLKALTIDPTESIEGNDISISCEVKKKNIASVWYKNGSPVSYSDNIRCDKNDKKHTLKITSAALSDSAVYCIEFEGVKRQIELQVEAYLSENVSNNTKPTEGDDIRIIYDVLYRNYQQNDAKWSKDGIPVKLTERVNSVHMKEQYTLQINKSNIYDSGNYSIDVDGRKRSWHLEVKPKYNIPLEIQKMDETDKDRYIKILREGNEKRYHIKIMILGRHGVGKTCIMRRLLKEPIHDVQSTDGIDIMKQSKVDIESKEWIFCHDDTTVEANARIGRALRQTWESDSLDHPKENVDPTEQERQNKERPQQTAVPATKSEGERSLHFTNYFDKTPGIVHVEEDTKQDTNVSNENFQVTTDDYYPVLSFASHKDISSTHENIVEYVENETTENIETVLEIGCNATVPDREFADCIIMDFAGHKEYHSTHQTFLTKNAIYLVAFKFNEDNPFADMVDETEQLGFWVDNIHCYAQTGQDAQPGEDNPPIIMLCTGDDTPEDPNSVKRKIELKNIFSSWMTINQRNSHIRGQINFISNTNPSETSFNLLRKVIVDIATNMPVWGEHYPVRWISLERALQKLRKNGTNVVRLKTVLKEAENCSVKISNENEVILFLKYQHEIGNLVFFNDTNLKDCIILNPSWLIDAFKCIICANEFHQFSSKTHSHELLIFATEGVISFDFCQTLFEQKSKEHAQNSELVLQVMEKFDIIIKDKLRSKLYMCPSGIKCLNDNKEVTIFKEICTKNHIDKENLSPWLFVMFDFLPPALYDHLLVLCMRDAEFEKIQLYPQFGIFRILKSKGRDKLVICKSKKTIIIQKIHSGSAHYNSSGLRDETIPIGQDIFSNIASKIKDISEKYDIQLNCYISIKCGDTPDDFPDDIWSEQDIKSNPQRWCNHHRIEHNLENLLWFWWDRSKPELIPKAVNQKDVEASREVFVRSMILMMSAEENKDNLESFKADVLQVVPQTVTKSNIHEIVIESSITDKFISRLDNLIQKSVLLFILVSDDFVRRCWPHITEMKNFTAAVYDQQPLIVPVIIGDKVRLPFGLSSTQCLRSHKGTLRYKETLEKLLRPFKE